MYKQISKQAGRGSARRLVFRDASLRIACDIDGLTAAINPASLEMIAIGTYATGPYQALAGKDLVNGYHVATTLPSASRINSDPAMNGKPSIDINADNSDLRLAGLGVTPSFSYIWAGTIDPVHVATTNEMGILLSYHYDEDVRGWIRWENDNLRFRISPEDNMPGNTKFSLDGSVPTDGLPHLYAWTLDAASLRMQLFIDDFETPIWSYKMKQPPADTPQGNIYIGTQYASTSAGHVGKYGKMFFYDRDISRTDRSRFISLGQRLKSEYGIG